MSRYFFAIALGVIAAPGFSENLSASCGQKEQTEPTVYHLDGPAVVADAIETPAIGDSADYVESFAEAKRDQGLERRARLENLASWRDARMEAAGTERYLFQRALAAPSVDSVASAASAGGGTASLR